MSLSAYKVQASVPVSHIVRAAEFYEGTLGLRAGGEDKTGSSRIYRTRGRLGGSFFTSRLCDI